MASKDARAMAALAGEARELLMAGTSCREHVIEGLGRLLGARVACLATVDVTNFGAVVDSTAVMFGFAPDELALMAAYMALHGSHDLPNVRAPISRAKVVTVGPLDYLTKEEWDRSVIANEVHKPCRLGDSLFSFRPSRRGLRTIVLKRAAGDRPFSPGERAIVDYVQRELAWFDREPAKVSHGR